MPITLTLFSYDEKKPEHNEEIVFFKKKQDYFEYFEPEHSVVEYCWFELDEKGVTTGNQACFDPETESEFKLGQKTKQDGSDWLLLAIVGGGYIMDERIYWMNSEDFHNCLPYSE